MNPESFTGGPGFLTWNSVTFQLLDNWDADTEFVTRDISTSLQGPLGKRELYAITRIKAKPIAFTGSLATFFTKLLPYRATQIGNLVRTSTDLPAVIQTKDGKSITFTTAILTKMPEMFFGSALDLFGDIELTVLYKRGTAHSATDSHVVVATSAYTEPTLAVADLSASLYTLAWGGSSPFTNISTDENGIKFTPTVRFSERKTSREQLLNMQIEAVEATVDFTPVNIDSADFYDNFMQVDGSAAGVGKLLGLRGKALTITGDVTGDPLLTVPVAVPTKGKLQLHRSASRVGAVTLEAHRTDSSGTLQDMFTLGVVP